MDLAAVLPLNLHRLLSESVWGPAILRGRSALLLSDKLRTLYPATHMSSLIFYKLKPFVCACLCESETSWGTHLSAFYFPAELWGLQRYQLLKHNCLEHSQHNLSFLLKKMCCNFGIFQGCSVENLNKRLPKMHFVIILGLTGFYIYRQHLRSYSFLRFSSNYFSRSVSFHHPTPTCHFSRLM